MKQHTGKGYPGDEENADDQTEQEAAEAKKSA